MRSPMRNTRKIHGFQRSPAALLALSLILGPTPAHALRIEQKTEQPRAGLEELRQSLAGLEEEAERRELQNSLRAWPPRIFPVTVVQNARYPYQIRVRYGSLEGAVPVRFVLQNGGDIQNLNVLSGWVWKHEGERFYALPMHVPPAAPVVFALINSWNVPQPETSQQWLKSPALFRLGVSRVDPSFVEELLSRLLREGADPRFRLLQWSRSREEWESLLHPRARWAIVHWMAEHRTPEPVGFSLLSFFENVASHRSSPSAGGEDSARGLAARVAGEMTAEKRPPAAGLEERPVVGLILEHGLSKLDGSTRRLIEEYVVPVVEAKGSVNERGERFYKLLEQLWQYADTEVATRALDSASNKIGLSVLAEHYLDSALADLLHWINVYVLLPQKISADLVAPRLEGPWGGRFFERVMVFRLLPVEGCELFGMHKGQPPVAVVYTAALYPGDSASDPSINGWVSFRTAFVRTCPSVEGMESTRIEELGHIVDIGRRREFIPQATLPVFLASFTRDGDPTLADEIVDEIRALLRHLSGRRGKEEFKAFSPVSLDQLRLMMQGKVRNPHLVARYWVKNQLRGLAENSAGYAARRLWRQQFKDRIGLGIRRIYPKDQPEASSQLEAIALASAAGLEETAQQKLETVRAHLHNLLGMHSSAQGALRELLSAFPPDEPGRSTLEGVRASLNQLDRDLGQRQASYRRVTEDESTADGAALPVRLQMKIGMIEAIGNAYGALLEIPEKGPGEKPKAASYRRVLRSSIDSIRRVVRETEEEIEGIRPAAEVIDLAVMLESHRDQWRFFAGFIDEEQFSVDMPPAPLNARVDAVALIEVMENLLLNARNAMRAAGILPTGRIAVRLFSEDGTHRISVRNDGPPLPERFLERINAGQVPAVVVEDETGAEHGLGLPFVARKAREWGGRLEARNLPGPERGVEFTLILPAAELAAAPLTAGLEEVKLVLLLGSDGQKLADLKTALHKARKGMAVSPVAVTDANLAPLLSDLIKMRDPGPHPRAKPDAAFLIIGRDREFPSMEMVTDELRKVGIPVVYLREIPGADALGKLLERLDRGAMLRPEDSFLLRSPESSTGDFNWEELFGFPMQRGVAELEIVGERMRDWPLEQARGVLGEFFRRIQDAITYMGADAVGFLLPEEGAADAEAVFWVSKDQIDLPIGAAAAHVGRTLIFTTMDGRLPDFLVIRLAWYRAAPGDAPRRMAVLVPIWSDEEPSSPAGLEEWDWTSAERERGSEAVGASGFGARGGALGSGQRPRLPEPARTARSRLSGSTTFQAPPLSGANRTAVNAQASTEATKPNFNAGESPEKTPPATPLAKSILAKSDSVLDTTERRPSVKGDILINANIQHNNHIVNSAAGLEERSGERILEVPGSTVKTYVVADSLFDLVHSQDLPDSDIGSAVISFPNSPGHPRRSPKIYSRIELAAKKGYPGASELKEVVDKGDAILLRASYGKDPRIYVHGKPDFPLFGRTRNETRLIFLWGNRLALAADRIRELEPALWREIAGAILQSQEERIVRVRETARAIPLPEDDIATTVLSILLVYPREAEMAEATIRRIFPVSVHDLLSRLREESRPTDEEVDRMYWAAVKVSLADIGAEDFDDYVESKRIRRRWIIGAASTLLGTWALWEAMSLLDEREPRKPQGPSGREVRSAAQRVEETLVQLSLQVGPGRRSVTVIGPSLYQERYPALPVLIEQALGPVREQIFLDPGDADGRAEWAARLYGRQELPAVSYFGSDQEFESFSSFGRTAQLTVLRSPESGSSNPVLFVMRLLELLGLPTGTLSATQRDELERDLELLIRA